MLKHSLSKAVSELKNNWLKVVNPEEILAACQCHDLSWRKRLLDPVTTIQLFLLQILHGNTSITHLRFFTTRGFSAAGYCQARTRIPVSILKTLLEKMTKSIRSSAEGGWHGRRLLLVDGSNFSMSDTKELRDHFGQPSGQKEGCGFPAAHFLAIMHAGIGLIQDVLPGRLFTHDLASFVNLHPALRRGDVIVGDRGFCSFANLALLVSRGVDTVFRVHQKQIVNFRAGRCHGNIKRVPRSRWRRKLGVTDQLVIWIKPARPPSWMTKEQYQNLPEDVQLRELSYNIDKPGYRVQTVTLVTTLTDPNQFPKEVLAEVYKERWQIETNFNHLKTTMNMNVVRCKTVDGVLRELYAFCIVYNLIRTVMMHAGKALRCNPERISFIDAMRWLKTSCQTPCFIQILVVPLRPNRCEPRAIKRRPKPYDLLVKPRNLYKSEFFKA